MESNDTPRQCSVFEPQVKRAIPGWRRYLLALRKAPFRVKPPRLNEEVASGEIQRIENMARYWGRRYSQWGEGFDEQVDILPPSAFGELRAATALDVLAEQREGHRDIAAIEERINEENDPGSVEDLVRQREELRSKVNEISRHIAALDTSHQLQWKLTPDEILDICEGVDPEDLAKDIL